MVHFTTPVGGKALAEVRITPRFTASGASFSTLTSVPLASSCLSPSLLSLLDFRLDVQLRMLASPPGYPTRLVAGSKLDHP